MWLPHPKGKFKTSWIPDPERQNKSVKRTFHGVTMTVPDNSEIGAFGIDPYSLVGQSSDGNGSDGAIVGFTKHNMTGAPCHSFFLIYKERPDKIYDFFEDCIMACRFWGMFANIESNKGRILEYFWEKGYT